MTDPAALLGVSQSPEPAPGAFSPPSQTSPSEMLPVSSFTQGPRGMSSTVMLHLTRDVPAYRTPQCQLMGRRKPLPCTRAGDIPSKRLPWTPVSRWMAFVPSSCIVVVLLGSQRTSWISPLAGIFNSAIFISPLPLRDLGGTGRVGSVSSPCLAACFSQGTRWAVLGHSPATNSPCPSLHQPQFPQHFEDPL